MRHISHGLSHGLRHLDIVVTWVKRNAAVVAVSLLVPLVALGALAIPPRVVQGVAAPLWRALASPLGDGSTRHMPGLHGDPAATPSESAHLASAGLGVAVADVTGGLRGPNRRAGGQSPVSEGLDSAEEKRIKPPSGGAGATGDDADPSEEAASGGGDGSGADDETGGGRADRPGRGPGDGSGGGRGNPPDRGNDDGCSATTARTAVSRIREATATAAETATALAEATAATAVSAANLATGTAVKTATPITEAATAAGAGTAGATLSGAATGAVATIVTPRRR